MSVGRHTIYNLVGSIAPILVMVLTVPAYLHLVGNTRYGVLALVWMFLGYFGIFDPGIGRAASYHIARLHNGPAKDREDVFWTAMVINLGFGLVGGIILYLMAWPLFVSAFKMPEAMDGEVIASLPWLAASIPVSIVGSVLGGVLQAREWFGVSNAVNVVNGVLSQIVPLVVAYFHGPDLTWLIPAILVTRAVGVLPIFLSITKALPLGSGGGFNPALLKTLFSYGGWITISNLLNPLLTSMDRMLIGSVLNTDAVAFYSVSYNLVGKVSIFPAAFITSLFPKLSRGNTEDAVHLASDAVIELAAVMTPLILMGIIALPIFMRLWVGLDFSEHAAPIGMILLLGMWVNGLACIPYGHLQARNRPDIVAKCHAVEIVPFLGLLWLGLHFYGLIGAALATTLRVTVDALLLFAFWGKLRGWHRVLPGAVLILIAPFCAPAVITSPMIGVASILVALSFLWSWSVAPSLRGAIISRIMIIRRLKMLS